MPLTDNERPDAAPEAGSTPSDAAGRVTWNGTTIERRTLYGPEESLTRDELWVRYRLAIQVLESLLDHVDGEPGCWPEELVTLVLGHDDTAAPRVKGSLADPCDAVQITHAIDDGVRKEVDRHFCIYRRGHTEQPDGPQRHRTAFGTEFDTGEIEEEYW